MICSLNCHPLVILSPKMPKTELIKKLKANPSVPSSRESVLSSRESAHSIVNPPLPTVNHQRDNFNLVSTVATPTSPWSNVLNSPPHQQRQTFVNDSFRNNTGNTAHGGAIPKIAPKIVVPPSNQINPPNNDNEQRRVLNNIAPPSQQSGKQNIAAAAGTFVSSSNAIDNDGFQQVAKVKRPRKPPIYGTRSNPATEKRMAGEKSDLPFSLFIGGVSNHFDENDLNVYIREELKVVPLGITINKINPKNRSYKVTVPREHKDVLFKPENWERNIVIKPFRSRKLQQQQNTPNGGGEQQQQ